MSRGYSVPVPYVKAIFEDERLPVKEGWTKRSWWHLGLMELYALIEKLKIGHFFSLPLYRIDPSRRYLKHRQSQYYGNIE